MTAYAYLRKSSVRDPSREVSYEVQEQSVRDMAERAGDAELVILSDWDKSGRLGADKRPGYRRLLEAIQAGEATAVYSYSLSRLARSVAELARLIDDCTNRGVPVRLYADHVDTSTASGRLLTNVLSSVAQFEADVASERVRAANAAKVARGETIATTPFYGDRPGEDPDAVLQAFRDAGSFSGAAKLLNERNVRPRTSRRGWWPSAVAQVVKRLDPSIGRRGYGRGVGAAGSDFLLARLLRCPTCGTLLTGTRDRAGRRVRYACRMGTALPHPRISVTEAHILPAIREEADRLSTPAAAEGRTGSEERGALEERRQRVLDMYESGAIDRDDYRRRLTAIADAESRLDARDVVMTIPALDWSWPPRTVNNVLRAVFDGIELDAATFQPVAFAWAVPEWRS